MTASPTPRARTTTDVDRDIEASRRERGRALVQIDQYLASIEALRTKYAKAGGRIDGLLEERHTLTSQVSSES